jgi:hypothetical protein
MSAKEKDTGAGKLQRTAFFLALFGFLPFAFLTILLLAQPGLIPPETDAVGRFAFGAVLALKAYAAIILSFLGGIRWGLAIKSGTGSDAEILVLSVIPSLVGWFAFFLAEPWSFAIFAIGFAVQGWWDRRLVASGGAPRWFGQMRFLLTILVTGTMLTAFAATF